MSSSENATAKSIEIYHHYGDGLPNLQVNQHVIDYYCELIYTYEKKKGIK